MFDSLLHFFNKYPKDSIYERIERESVFAKYNFLFGMVIIFSIVTILVASYSMLIRRNPPLTETNIVDLNKKTVQTIPTVPFAHQSFKNVASWFYSAVAASIAFDFNNVDERIDSASYYFTEAGYDTYLKAITSSNVRNDVIRRRLQISVIPLQDPVAINSGTVADTEFWRYRVPVLVNYYAGGESRDVKMMVEALIIRVPSYQNEKGLAITEFNMVPI